MAFSAQRCLCLLAALAPAAGAAGQDQPHPSPAGKMATQARQTARADSVDGPAAEKARPSLIAETASIAPGETILIGVTFDIEPGWHTYWHGRNDTVPGPWFEFSAPEGFTVGPLLWPAPKRYEAAGGLLDHVYERQVTIMAPLTAPEELDAESVEISANVNWTVCSDLCLMGEGAVHLSLPVSRTVSAGRHAGRFADARQRLPGPLLQTDELTTRRDADRIEIEVPGASRLAFYPHEKGPALTSVLRDGEVHGSTLTLRLRDGQAEGRATEPLVGVLEVWREGAGETELIELRITTDGNAESVAREPIPAPPVKPADGA